jgi:hypothetical protein
VVQAAPPPVSVTRHRHRATWVRAVLQRADAELSRGRLPCPRQLKHNQPQRATAGLRNMHKRHSSDAHNSASAAADQVSLPVHDNENTLPQEWPFETNFGDHFETPLRSFKDIKPVRLLSTHMPCVTRADALPNAVA